MQLPRWLLVLVGLTVVLFGVYRIWFSFQKPKSEDDPQRRGLYAYPGRRHLLIGTVYVIAGGMLLASGLGLNVRFW